jgi:PIN domain nuclease of toxin-antitoxin system
LQLLINQYGDVDRVVVEESALPQVLLAELQAKFLQARFTPGRLDTRAVSSAVRIEVQLQ